MGILPKKSIRMRNTSKEETEKKERRIIESRKKKEDVEVKFLKKRRQRTIRVIVEVRARIKNTYQSTILTCKGAKRGKGDDLVNIIRTTKIKRG